MKVNDAGQYVSDDNKWVWDGTEWLPNTSPAEAALTAAESMGYDEAVDAPTPERTTISCNEQDCQEPAKDYVRIAMTAVNGSMTVECLLCELHITTMEMNNTGSFLYIRPRDRLDLNGR